MKADNHLKSAILNMLNEKLKPQKDVLVVDGVGGFDTHWIYSYIMDFILLYKAKKRKS
jgi:hypothetical protein